MSGGTERDRAFNLCPVRGEKRNIGNFEKYMYTHCALCVCLSVRCCPLLFVHVCLS